MTPTAIVAMLDARDRALFERWSIRASTSRTHKVAWVVLTHIGGVWCSVIAALTPFLAPTALQRVGESALVALVVSHLIVQVIKRTVGRPRPARVFGCAALVEAPDRFSFPSGHAAASMSVAFMFAVAFPALAVPLLVLAVLVGVSRVCLGVHYPGDVMAGQHIALITGAIVLLV
jgi:undecaprenyl-diphosphatase